MVPKLEAIGGHWIVNFVALQNTQIYIHGLPKKTSMVVGKTGGESQG